MIKLSTIHKPNFLAIVITTFDRSLTVSSAITNLTSQLDLHPHIAHCIKLILINNGEPNDIAPLNDTTIINNPNLGGSGGFARGLYEASKDPSITHCLFMDDDASCDINAIIKTVEQLSSSNNPNLAIAGCMAYEHKPWLLHEAGAHMLFFDMTYRANKHNLDITKAEDIKEFTLHEHIDYGGWWFYAFPIKATPYYPFPFFVRGDDVLFGLMNPHEIAIDSDIRSAQPCFLRKFTPWVIYLVFRASFVHGSYRKKLLSPVALQLYFNFHVLRYALSYRYTMALAIIEAFKDGNKGLTFWRENIDAKEPMQRIKALQPKEEYHLDFDKISISAIEPVTPLNKESRLRKWLYVFTLNGHLIPGILFKQTPYAISETLITPMGYAFCRRRLVMINETTGKTMALTHSKKLFFSIIFKMGWLSFKSLFTLNKTMKAYQKGIPSMCTRAFWEDIFKEYDCLDDEK